MQPEWLDEDAVFAVFDTDKKSEADALVAKAFAEIDRGFPVNQKVDTKRRARAARIGSHIPSASRDLIVAIVAQWLSAREAPAAAKAARKAAGDIRVLLQKIEDTRNSIGKLDRALRFAATTHQGAKVQGLAQVVAGSLDEAARALSMTRSWADELIVALPANAKGKLGTVGAMRVHTPNEMLAIDLSREWLSRGLTLDGGEAGDGLDIFVKTIVGDPKDAEEVLTLCRREYKNLT